MKYANIVFDGARKGSVNLGDDMQLLAIRNIYDKMGVSEDEIVEIPYTQLRSYKGEYVILPISFPLYGFSNEMTITCFSPYIIPVFLGLSIMSNDISEDEVAYLRRFEPIGCRDSYTMMLLREKNILSYVGGCSTALLPRRHSENAKHIYMIDIPERYYQYIPNEIKNDAIKKSQIVYECENPKQAIREMLDDYCRNARLIITTRLHCALPCIASGIPVIIMRDDFSFRFTALERFVHIYTKDEFDRIDWNPASVDYEIQKKHILDMSIQRIRTAFTKYSDLLDVSSFYEASDNKKEHYIEHVDNVKKYIDEYAESHGLDFKYGFWGITQKSSLIYRYICENYPYAKLVVCYDRDKRIKWNDVITTNDFDDLLLDDVIILVTAATANRSAVELFEANNKKNYYVSDDDVNVVSKKYIESNLTRL